MMPMTIARDDLRCARELFMMHDELDSDNDNLNSHKYVCITTYQPDIKSNPNLVLLTNLSII